MQRDSIKKRLEVLEARQPPEEVESRDIEISEEAEDTYKKWYLACEEATETEKDFEKLFIGCACDSLYHVCFERIEREFNPESDNWEERDRKMDECLHLIDLEVMEEMVKILKQKGVSL